MIKDLRSTHLEERALPFDMRDAFGVNTKADEPMPHFIGEYLKINKRFTTQVLPKVFLSYTPTFLNMTKAVFDFASLDSASKSRVNKDLLAYITIKAYMKQLAENEEATTAIGGSLSNDFIYPSDSDNNVVNVIKNLKNNPKTRDNYYLNYYLTGLTANDEKNKTGLNIATTNTFGRRSDEEAIRIQNGAQALYVDKDTRRDAMHIIHFTMVKDGLSFTYGSIMDSITPYGLDSYLRAAGKAFDAFRGKLSFEEVFGLTQRELVTEFIQNYPKSVSFVDSITRSLPKKGYNVETDTDKGEVTYTLDTAQKKNKPKEFPMYYQQEALFGPPVLYVMTEASMSLGDGPAVDTFDPTQGKIPGSRFKYKRFEPMGAYTQTAIGFMFGDRPSFDEFRLPKPGSANVPGDPQNYDQFLTQGDLDGYSPEQREDLNKLDIIATDRGVEFERPEGVKDSTETLVKFFAAKDAGQPTQSQAGVEISSNAKGLAAALTNPTHYNPKGKSAKQKGNLDSKYSYLDAGIEFEGTLYKDVEEAYSKLKQNYPDRNTKGPKSTYSLMVNLITAKLQQHPQLVQEITAQGGGAWLSSSTHQPTRKNTVWETGGQNWFIESLTEAYNQVTSTTQPQAAEVQDFSKYKDKDWNTTRATGRQMKMLEHLEAYNKNNNKNTQERLMFDILGYLEGYSDKDIKSHPLIKEIEEAVKKLKEDGYSFKFIKNQNLFYIKTPSGKFYSNKPSSLKETLEDTTQPAAETSKEVEITPDVSKFSQLKLDLDSTQSDEFTEALRDLEQKSKEIGLPKSVIDNMRTQYGVDMRSSEGLRKSFEDSKFRTLKEYIDHVKECIMPPF